MLTFGIIAEGATDQTVIENILLGYFQKQEEPSINYIQPPRPQAEKPGGWTNVFRSLVQKDYVGALQYNDYLVIHIDTDVQEEPGFGVPRLVDGVELTIVQLVDRVVTRLKQEIDNDFNCVNSHRILFAIAVDTIECWLLPLLSDGKKAEKITGCLAAANWELRRTGREGLSAGENKFIKAYDKASSQYRRRRTLMDCHKRNPSLTLFINQLATLDG
jgi:hypothetical protein